MLQFTLVLLCSIVAGSSLDCQKSSDFVSQSEDDLIITDCGSYCFSAMRPVMGYVADSQRRWQTCEAIITNQTQREQNQIKVQLKNMQDTLSRLETHQNMLEIKLSNVQETVSGIKEILDTMVKTWLKAFADENQTKGLQKAECCNQMPPPGFVKAGSRYFHVENNKKLNWYSAEHTCRRWGGHLASPRKEHLDALRLKPSITYWLGISDLAHEGSFVSTSNGHPAFFTNWGTKQPDNFHQKQHCVALRDSYMDDDVCNTSFNFICQFGDEN